MKALRLALTTALAFGLSVSAVWAQDIEARIIAQLRNQGFTQFEVTRTWLGRTRIEAEGPGIEREIIFNPRTGEILRDYWEREDDDEVGGIVSPNSGSGSSSGEDDDDDDHSGPGGGGEDDDEDDDDDDRDDDDDSDDDDSDDGEDDSDDDD